MDYATARHLRKNLSAYLDSNTPTIIGNQSRPRAMLVPIATSYSWTWKRRPSPIVKAQRAALDTLRQLRQHVQR